MRHSEANAMFFHDMFLYLVLLYAADSPQLDRGSVLGNIGLATTGQSCGNGSSSGLAACSAFPGAGRYDLLS